MTNHYKQCKLCSKIIVDSVSDFMTNHLDLYHPEYYKKLINEESEFQLGIAKLQEKFPMSVRGIHDFFNYYAVTRLTYRQKKAIKIYSFKMEKD